MIVDGVRLEQVSGVDVGVIVVNVRSAVTFAALLDDHSRLGSDPQRASKGASRRADHAAR